MTSSIIHTLKPFTPNYVPTQSEVRELLGTPLAQLYFNYSHPEIKKSLGLTPLKGPIDLLWISPSNYLRNRIVLTPKRSEIIKAFTHEKILGEELLTKFEKDVEQKVKENLEYEFLERYYMFEAEKRKEMEMNSNEIQLEYQNYIKMIHHSFEETLENELAKATEKSNKQIQKAVVQERMTVTQEMLRKMRSEISYVISSLHDEFEKSNQALKENMIADFNEIMRSAHTEMSAKVNELKRENAEALHAQRYELEIQNAVDIINVLCQERLRCDVEKHIIHTRFENDINAVEDFVIDLNNVMLWMREQIEEDQKTKRLLQEKIREITGEFQKFINFAINAMPEQADFLLSKRDL